MLTSFIKKISGNPFMRNVSILSGGTVFSQGLVALFLPVLTRLYSPEDFSLLAVYLSLTSIIIVISCLRLNMAIPLPDDDQEGFNLLVLAIIFSTIVGLLLALLTTFYPQTLLGQLNQPLLSPYLWMVPVGVFFASTYNALQYWSSRKKRFGLIARTRMSRAVGSVGIQVGAGVISPSPAGLLYGNLAFNGLGIVSLLRSIFRNDRNLFESISHKSLLASLYIYRRFPLYSVPESLFNVAGTHIPILLIAAIDGSADAGFLLLATRVMGLPMGVIGTSIAQVFLVEAPSRKKDGKLREFTLTTMKNLAKVGAPPLIAIGAISPFLFPYIFGADWARAGLIVAWMTPWFVLQFIASPISVVIYVTGHMKTALALQMFGFLLRTGMVWFAISANAVYTAKAYALSGMVFYAVYIVVILMVLYRSGTNND